MSLYFTVCMWACVRLSLCALLYFCENNLNRILQINLVTIILIPATHENNGHFYGSEIVVQLGAATPMCLSGYCMFVVHDC